MAMLNNQRVYNQRVYFISSCILVALGDYMGVLMPGPRGSDSRISPHPREGLREDMVHGD